MPQHTPTCVICHTFINFIAWALVYYIFTSVLCHSLPMICLFLCTYLYVCLSLSARYPYTHSHTHSLIYTHALMQVGVGALAGSTIMLLTIPWILSIYGGRVDIDSRTGQPTYSRRPKLSAGNTSLTGSGVVLTSDVNKGGL
jgi:hypothetical protein